MPITNRAFIPVFEFVSGAYAHKRFGYKFIYGAMSYYKHKLTPIPTCV